MTPMLIVVCGWFGFGAALIVAFAAVCVWERLSGRSFDPLMREQAREIRELPELEPRRRIA